MLAHLSRDLSKARGSSRERARRTFAAGTEDTGRCLAACGGFGLGPRGGTVALGGVPSASAARQSEGFPREKDAVPSPRPAAPAPQERGKNSVERLLF